MNKILGTLFAILLLAGCSSEHSHPVDIDVELSENQTVFHGRFLEVPFQLPRAEFKDTSGAKVSWPNDELPAEVTIVFFGYTNCADGYCHTQTANVAAALRGLSAKDQKRVNFVFITTDPPRDSATVLRTYLDLHNTNFIGLRANIEEIQRAGLALGVHVDDIPSPRPTYNYDVGHGLQLFAFLSSKTSPLFWMEDNSVQEIRQDLKTLLNGTWENNG